MRSIRFGFLLVGLLLAVLSMPAFGQCENGTCQNRPRVAGRFVSPLPAYAVSHQTAYFVAPDSPVIIPAPVAPVAPVVVESHVAVAVAPRTEVFAASDCSRAHFGGSCLKANRVGPVRAVVRVASRFSCRR